MIWVRFFFPSRDISRGILPRLRCYAAAKVAFEKHFVDVCVRLQSLGDGRLIQPIRKGELVGRIANEVL